MIKRAQAAQLISSSDEDDIEMDPDEDISDIDEGDMDKELELVNIDNDIIAELKNEAKLQKNQKNKNKNKDKSVALKPHQIQQLRLKLHRKQEQQKQAMIDIVEQNLIHRNDRLRKTQYINKQRTLIFGSRGINQRARHLIKDLSQLIPHSKSEPKFDDRRELSEIKQLCMMRNCNNCLFFEAHKICELYLWIARIPNGPSMKFYVTNVHTLNELRMTGNCLLGSRPILVFDAKFDSQIQFRLMKELFMQIFGTPNGHPQSKPFIDRTMAFHIIDHKIWIRNYQIVYENEQQTEQETKEPILVEIGPRLVLHPIRILQGAFGGSTIYQDPHYVSPVAERRAQKKSRTKQRNEMNTPQERIMHKIIKKYRRNEAISKATNILQSDPNREVFEQGIDL